MTRLEVAPRVRAGSFRLATIVLLCAAAASEASASDRQMSAGQRLYREGLGQSGERVVATVQGDVSVSASTLACVGCHKRSGLGASEGGQRAPAVTGPALFDPAGPRGPNPTRFRLPYTDATVARAITHGIAVDGRVLDPLMPRYQLGQADMHALTAYLHVLGAEPAAGVSETTLELATIVSAGAPAGEREAVAAVVRRFAATKNGGTRQEGRRATASRRHPYGEKHVRAFRHWNLSVWTLEGPAAGWPAQLDTLYEGRPPFAVISGATGPDWPVIHDFCERQELPCILPVTELPMETGGGHYTFYYSAGIRLEARVTASSIAADSGAAERKVLVLFVDDERGRAAYQAFAGAWPEQRRAGMTARPIDPSATPSFRDWKDVIHRERPDVLVAWLLPEQMQTLTSIASSDAALPRQIYTAASFTDWRSLQALPIFEQRVLHVYPYSLAAPGLAEFPREESWLASQGLGDLDRMPAAEALFACHAAGEALALMADNHSREYFIETLEHMLDGSGMTTIYPVTTLGTGQRFLVKGAYVVRLAPDAGGLRYVKAGWIQP